QRPLRPLARLPDLLAPLRHVGDAGLLRLRPHRPGGSGADRRRDAPRRPLGRGAAAGRAGHHRHRHLRVPLRLERVPLRPRPDLGREPADAAAGHDALRLHHRHQLGPHHGGIDARHPADGARLRPGPAIFGDRHGRRRREGL
ncbi:MAG: hypothetical protein AVDCRST_MAG04-803, partial [uncultured Acetobacteraceae bacterium]